MEILKAKRKNAKIKMALAGPSGSGKTFSALHLAYGLCKDWNKIAVIDSENHSSELYSNLGDYYVIPISEPFTPETYIKAIKLAEESGIEVLIIDSISHEWDGPGGILDIHSNMAGNSFTNWSKVTPRHNQFVQAMLHSKCHIISTIRTKQDYVLSDKNGKMVPEKVGLKGITKDGMDYEFTLVFDLDSKHTAVASKDRTRLFVDAPPFVIGFQIGTKILEWCNQDDGIQKIKEAIENCQTVQQLHNLYKCYPEYQEKLLDRFKKKNEELENANVIPSKINAF